MNYDRNERIRRAAILVASLDEAMAEALLGDLPPLDAAKVLAELERMDSLDPEEQADVLEEFRRATRRTGNESGAVEFSYSAASEAEVTGNLPAGRSDAEAASPTTQFDVHHADAAAMAELLSHEQPQIIAAALSRLGAERGAAVFAALPSELQAEALERICRLAPADEEAVLEVESLLLRQVDERREHRQRAAAGAELAQLIVAQTTPERRAVLLARLPGDGRSAVRTPSPRRDVVAPVAQQAIHLASAIDRQRIHDRFDDDLVNDPWSTSDAPAPLEDITTELLALDDETLVLALRAAGEQTVQRALAASGERLFDRVARMLPRRQARKLRRLVQAFGPTRLAELRQAQHELLRVAHQQQGVAA